MPPLNAAFAFAQMNDFAVLVSQHLKLDVPRKLQKLLHVDIRSAESLLRLAARRLIGAQEIFLLAHHAHAAPTTARGSLQNQWVAYALRFFRELLFSFHNSVASRSEERRVGKDGRF